MKAGERRRLSKTAAADGETAAAVLSVGVQPNCFGRSAA